MNILAINNISFNKKITLPNNRNKNHTPQKTNNNISQKPDMDNLPEIKQKSSTDETIEYVLIDKQANKPLTKEEAMQKVEKTIFELEQHLNQCKNLNEYTITIAKITKLKDFLAKIKML